MDILLKQKLESENYAEREELAKYLAKSKTQRDTFEILIQLLHDNESIVRSASINSIMEIGAKQYLRTVLPLLDDKDEVVRVDAVECVASLGGKKAVKYLIKHLNDPSEIVRSYVGGAIGQFRLKYYSKHLQKALGREHSSLAKVGLLEGLFLLGQKYRILEIIHYLKSRRYIVRCAVANTLNGLANHENKELIVVALVNALKVETTVAAKSSIQNALKCLQTDQRP